MIDFTGNQTKGFTAMDKNVIEAVESLTGKQLNLFLAWLQGISDSQRELPYSDRTEKQQA